MHFAFLNIGKYRNFEPNSGNPFELARNFFHENIGENDLIISALYDTKAGFYFGDIISGYKGDNNIILTYVGTCNYLCY